MKCKGHFCAYNVITMYYDSYVRLTDIQENTTGKAIGKLDMVLELCMKSWRQRARGRCIYRGRFIMLLALTHASVLYPTLCPPFFFI